MFPLFHCFNFLVIKQIIELIDWFLHSYRTSFKSPSKTISTKLFSADDHFNLKKRTLVSCHMPIIFNVFFNRDSLGISHPQLCNHEPLREPKRIDFCKAELKKKMCEAPKSNYRHFGSRSPDKTVLTGPELVALAQDHQDFSLLLFLSLFSEKLGV